MAWPAWRRTLRRRWRLLLLIALLGGYWLLPISGQVVVLPAAQSGISQATLWPRVEVDPASPTANGAATMRVTDAVPWANVLLTVDGEPAAFGDWSSNPGGTWTWRWTLTPAPSDQTGQGRERVFTFYHDCDTGCVERGRWAIGGPEPAPKQAPAAARGLPTKLGLVFANPERDWHGRSGWDVELTYARLAGEPDWGIDGLATRVQRATNQGLRVLVRVDYDRGQSVPPTDDQLALTEYLRYLQRLARDDRLRGVYGYVIGSGFNAQDSNTQAPERPATPAWYARLFNGYGESVTRTDNVVQTIRPVNPTVKVLVGPVRPWIADQDGERRFTVDAPWLNYLNTLVAAVDEAARTKAAAGIPLAAPDGWALQVPGRPSLAEQTGRAGAEEPSWDLVHPSFPGAQAGFRVYRDWLAVINAYPTTRELPVYITSTNTFAPDEGIPPAQNYPRGWLTTALQVIDAEPQVAALCWFLDGTADAQQWEWFSLIRQAGRLVEAADEFDELLRTAPATPATAARLPAPRQRSGVP